MSEVEQRISYFYELLYLHMAATFIKSTAGAEWLFHPLSLLREPAVPLKATFK